MLRSTGDWVAAVVEQSIGWPEVATAIDYKGRTFILVPRSSRGDQVVAMRSDLDWKDARKLTCEFCSALGWAEGGHVAPVGWGHGSSPTAAGRAIMPVGRMGVLHLNELPVIANASARLAMAFFREASSLENVGYAVLSYFKILNIEFKSGDRQKHWIRTVIPEIQNHVAKDRVAELVAKGEDVADYLYESCRCAVAHAHTEPLVDPDDIDDQHRLYADLALIREVAALTLEKRFGLRSPETVYREHRYNLGGFENVLKPYWWSLLRAGRTLEPGAFRIAPLQLRVRDGSGVVSLRSIVLVAESWNADGIMEIKCVSESGRFRVRFILDFPTWTLSFDPLGQWSYVDDGSLLSGIEGLEVELFRTRIFGNGQLELWDASTNQILGRANAYMPHNFFLRTNALQWTRDQWEPMLRERAASFFAA